MKILIFERLFPNFHRPSLASTVASELALIIVCPKNSALDGGVPVLLYILYYIDRLTASALNAHNGAQIHLSATMAIGRAALSLFPPYDASLFLKRMIGPFRPAAM